MAKKETIAATSPIVPMTTAQAGSDRINAAERGYGNSVFEAGTDLVRADHDYSSVARRCFLRRESQCALAHGGIGSDGNTVCKTRARG